MTAARRPAPVSPPVAVTIAGSDSGGGAGIQADIKTMEAHGVFATSVLTAVTAQNTTGVTSSHVLPTEEIEAQFRAVDGDFELGAAKTGMLATAPVIELVTELLAEAGLPTVVDPVMIATSGDRLLEPAAESAYEDLLVEASLVTPNADEATVLTDVEVDDVASATAAGEALVDLGADAALVKGGHIGGDVVRDVLVTPGDATIFEHPRIETEATHGSGCTLASAIAARVARGESLRDAVEAGVAFMERAVRYGLDVGHGPGAVHHLVELRDRAEREPTAELVEGVVQRFVDVDVSPLVPEVGMNVVGATPHAEAVADVAAVEGRITRIKAGVKPNRGIRFGASSHVARFLLAAREIEPSLRFAVNCRFNGAVEEALGALQGPVAEFDRAAEPADVKAAEGSTMQWGARRAFADGPKTPVAVIDRGEVGKEAIVKLVAESPETLVDRTMRVLEAL